jgi:hypothetical protein
MWLIRIALAILVFASPALARDQGPALGEGAERFAGTPVAVDDRLRARSCAAPGGFSFGWTGAASQAVEARCATTGERLVLPLAAPPAEPARLKRGETVQAQAQGAGFRLSVGAVAESAGRDGRVILRNSRSGQRFAARLDPVGRIIVSETDH